MAYHIIVKERYLKIIGECRVLSFENEKRIPHEYRYIVELNEWDKSKGADLRLCNYASPYKYEEGLVHQNYKHHTFLLRLKNPRCKYQFNFMLDDETWGTEIIKLKNIIYYEAPRLIPNVEYNKIDWEEVDKKVQDVNYLFED